MTPYYIHQRITRPARRILRRNAGHPLAIPSPRSTIEIVGLLAFIYLFNMVVGATFAQARVL